MQWKPQRIQKTGPQPGTLTKKHREKCKVSYLQSATFTTIYTQVLAWSYLIPKLHKHTPKCSITQQARLYRKTTSQTKALATLSGVKSEGWLVVGIWALCIYIYLYVRDVIDIYSTHLQSLQQNQVTESAAARTSTIQSGEREKVIRLQLLQNTETYDTRW